MIIMILYPIKMARLYINIYLVGGSNPSEKYKRQLGWLFPIYGNIKNVPNHQPDGVCIEIPDTDLFSLGVWY